MPKESTPHRHGEVIYRCIYIVRYLEHIVLNSMQLRIGLMQKILGPLDNNLTLNPAQMASIFFFIVFPSTKSEKKMFLCGWPTKMDVLSAERSHSPSPQQLSQEDVSCVSISLHGLKYRLGTFTRSGLIAVIAFLNLKIIGDMRSIALWERLVARKHVAVCRSATLYLHSWEKGSSLDKLKQVENSLCVFAQKVKLRAGPPSPASRSILLVADAP